MRHAKAEQTGPTDFERRLAQRGLDDARAAGRWLADHDLVPDAVLVSAATRTRQTWEAVADAAGWPDDATYDEGLYDAGTATALDLLRATDDDATTLLVIGHNPTMASLAQLLDDGEGDDAAGNDLATGFPTSAMAVLAVDGGWSDVDEQSARLVAFHVARA